MWRKINDRDIKGANKPGFDELTTDQFVTLSSIWKGGGNTKEHSTSIIRALVKKLWELCSQRSWARLQQFWRNKWCYRAVSCSSVEPKVQGCRVMAGWDCSNQGIPLITLQQDPLRALQYDLMTPDLRRIAKTELSQMSEESRWALAYSVWTDWASSYTNRHWCWAARGRGEDERYLTERLTSPISAWGTSCRQWCGNTCEVGTSLRFGGVAKGPILCLTAFQWGMQNSE